MIWKKIADIILKNRLLILILIAVSSIFMGYEASKVRITFNGGKVLPGYNEKAGHIKDMSAGAVVIAALFALITGTIIFLPKLLLLFK